MTIVIRNKLTGAVMATVLGTTNLVGAQFGGWNLTNADFTNQDIRDADFSDANLSGAVFDGCKTGRADFTGANTAGASFVGVDPTVPTRWSFSKAFYEAYSVSRSASTIFRDGALWSDIANNTQYLSTYRKTQGRIVTAKRTIGGSNWTIVNTAVLGITYNINDNHHSISHMVDGSQRFHVNWCWLDEGYLYWHGTTAGDINVTGPLSLPIVPGEGALESNPAYPQYAPYHSSIGADRIFGYWEVGNPGTNYGIIIRYWNDALATWTTLTPLGLIKCGFCPYKTTFAWDSVGKLWLAGCWRDDTNITTNHDLWVMYSDPADGPVGTVWRDLAGNILTLPVVYGAAHNATVVTIPTNSGLVNSFGFCLVNDLPVISYWSGNPCNYYVANYTGSTWNVRQVGTQGINYTLVNNPGPSSPFPMCQPRSLAVNSDGSTWLFFESQTYPGLYGYHLTASELASSASLSSKNPEELCAYDFGGASFTFDENLWAASGILEFYGSRCDPADSTDFGYMLPVYVVRVNL